MRLGKLVVVAASVLLAVVASAWFLRGYSFGDWARDNGYSPGDAMPREVWAWRRIESLDGIGEFDWTTTPTTRLNLSNNQLSSIEASVFRRLAYLWELDLSNNQLSRIESGDFRGLTNLMKLSLFDNQLSSIESGGFSGLTVLKSLQLNRNQIQSIESGAFSGLASLTSLTLRNNQLSSIESGAFSGLASLTSLTLRNNQLSSIESGDFSELANLVRLDLSSNALSSIESGVFSGLTNLKELSLGGNQISSIESGAFSDLANLARLDLSSNVLSSIESGAFSGLTNLEELNLVQNIALTELNLAEAEFSRLTRFTVKGNCSISSVSLANIVVNQTSLSTLLGGATPRRFRPGPPTTSTAEFCGIGELDVIDGITTMDISGIDFADITHLKPLYVMDDLTDLWLVDTKNLDATDLDVLLDNLETIEGTEREGVLHMTQADFDALDKAGGGLLTTWNAEPGHHVEFATESSDETGTAPE